jgi:hypothetical protein
VAAIWAPGIVQLPFGGYKAPFDGLAEKQELLTRLLSIEGLSWSTGSPPTTLDRYPAILLAPLADAARFTQFIDVLDWFVGETRAASPGAR